MEGLNFKYIKNKIKKFVIDYIFLIKEVSIYKKKMGKKIIIKINQYIFDHSIFFEQNLNAVF